MKKNSAHRSAFFDPSVLISFAFGAIGLFLALVLFAFLPGGNALANSGPLPARPIVAFSASKVASPAVSASRTPVAPLAALARKPAQVLVNFTVTYDGNGNTGGTAPVDPNSPYLANATVTVLGNIGSLVRTGYTFSGWNTAANGSGTTYIPGATFQIASNVTLYAKWAYTVTYNGNGNTGGTAPVDPNSPYLPNATVTVLGPGTLVRTGYTFSGWNTAANGSGTSYNPGATFQITSNVTLYAKWTVNTYSVTYNGNGNTGGAVPLDPNSPYLLNATVTVMGQGSLVRNNFTFNGWNTAANGSGTSYSPGATFQITSNVTLYAKWAINTYTLTYTAGANGTISGTSPQTVNFGGSGTAVTAVPNTGYHFVNWSDSSTANPRTDTNVIANINVTANFASNAPFTFEHTGSLNTGRVNHTTTLLPNGKVLVAGGANGGSNLASAELYDPATGTWATTGSLATARSSHTATLLPNGKVLVAGGYNGGRLASAELYDPASGTWTATGGLATARNSHTATLLTNGKVLVAGGYDGSYLASAELYDLASGTWSATGSMITAHLYHTMTLLPNGKVLVAGGANGISGLASAELYDPASGAWSATGSLLNVRLLHTATLLPNGKVLVAGGEDGSSSVTSAELYNPASGTWSATGNLATAREYHSAALLPNGKVLVTGAKDFSSFMALASAELYDPASGTWSATSSMITARYYHTLTLLPNGKVLVAGGYTSISGNGLASAEVYDPANGAWSATGSLTAARQVQTATLLPNGKVLVAGGRDNSAYLASAELYDPASGTCSATGSLATARGQHTATLLSSGKVLVAGGSNSPLSALASAELYDPASGTWSATGGLATVRYSHTATLLPNGKVLVAGGNNGSSALASAELYDPASGTWSATGGLATVRYFHTATLLPNGRVLVAGGYDGSSSLASAELYDPASGTWTATTGPLVTACYSHTATLLPNGKVLVAGGADSNGALASAELYNPASGTWTATPSSLTARCFHTATLLPSGKVLVAAGSNFFSALASAELYDPASSSWSVTSSLSTARQSHTATLLPNGKVLVAGGGDSSLNTLASAQVYDTGLGFLRPGWQPQIATATSLLVSGSRLTLTGSRFQGISQASGGNAQDSPSNYPVVQLRSIDTSQVAFLPVDPAAGWSDTTFTSIPLSNIPLGPALVTVFTNGIPSASKYLVVVNTYTVSYSGNGNTGGAVPIDLNNPYIAYSTVTVLGNTGSMVKTGYTFSGWNTAANGSGTGYSPGATFPITSNVTLYANWTINSYTLSYTAGANGTISGTSPQTVNYGGNGTAVTAVPNTGYHFVNWSDSSTANPRTDMNVTANINVNATFAINTYTLTYTAGANGTVSGTSPQTVNYGGSGTAVTAVPNINYHFVNWSDSSTANPRADTNVIANVNVTANFWINTYTVSYDANGGTGTLIDPNNPYNYGSTVTALNPTGITRTGYTFTNWNTAANGSGTSLSPGATFNIVGNVALYAQWTLTPILGNYPNLSIPLSTGATVTPDASPVNTTGITVSTDSGFQGNFAASPTSGVVRVINAHPAGIYLVTVKALPGGTTKAFTLTVTDGCLTAAGFTNAADVSTGTAPYAVAIGDFNGDGKQDLAVANGSATTVSIRLGDGLGGFSGLTDVNAGSAPHSVAVGDFNGDGKQDLALANYSDGTVSIRLGDGIGGFSGSTEVGVGNHPQSVAVGDFNGDGKQDLAVANFLSDTVSIRLGDGMGGFSGFTEVSVGLSPYSVAIGDFNGDGKQDLATANITANSASIRLGDGLGGFTGSTEVDMGSGSDFVAIGDFNGDGKQDLAVANTNSSTVSVRLGDGLGGFSGSTDVSVGSHPSSVAIGDFNGDGKQDFATTNNGANTVSIRLGNGSGGFSSSTDLSAGPGPQSVVIGDFNGDGKQDLALANHDTNTVSIRLGQCSSPLALATAVSRKTHGSAGTFDIPLPLTGTPGVECRSSGNHTLVFTASNNLVSGNASVTTGTGSISGSPTFSGNTMTVNLTGVADVQKITVTLSNVIDGFAQVLPDTAVSMNILAGDINGNKAVSTTDIAQVKALAGVPVGAANFRADVAANGAINTTDIALVKSRSGQTVP